jgi:hypothetical protein
VISTLKSCRDDKNFELRPIVVIANTVQVKDCDLSHDPSHEPVQTKMNPNLQLWQSYHVSSLMAAPHSIAENKIGMFTAVQ